MNLVDSALDHGLPESLVRFGIRRLLSSRLKEEGSAWGDGRALRMQRFIAEMDRSPIALQPHLANEQHYEVPARFFELVLGPRLKYSCCWWEAHTSTLADAEENMLRLTAERAGIRDGQSILELGCGWGSLTLFLAEHFRNSRVVAVSNSQPQREFILRRAHGIGLDNVEVLTCDMNVFRTAERFDRVVSVEMFEHMRNYRELLSRIAGFLRSDGRLFIHIFVHGRFAYPFVPRDRTDWMARHFFSGGMMPSADLLHHFQDHFRMEEQWDVSGIHYRNTAEAWLQNHHAHRAEIEQLFDGVYGMGEGGKWWHRWRVFFLSCSELWGYRGGAEWYVGHYRMAPKGGA